MPLHRPISCAQLGAAATLCLFLTGCVSSKFATVSHPSPPSPINLPGTKAPLKTTLDHVIVQHGPGSWKREAFWDEYRLTLTNHHRAPVTITAVRLVDARGVRLDAGENVWQLEAESRDAWSPQALAQNAELGVRSVLTVAGRAVAPVGALVGIFALYGLPLTGPGAATLLFPLLTEKLHSGNEAGQREVTYEFDSRRLALPATLSPGATLTRSAFFRISPSPQRLVLSYQVDDEFHDVTVNLAVLAGYHANNGLNLDPIPTPIAPLLPPTD